MHTINWCLEMFHFVLASYLHCILTTIQTGLTALHAAAQGGHWRVVELLLEANADVDIKTNARVA